jgi:hypothetical protein
MVPKADRAVALHEGHVARRISVVADGMRQLLEDDRQADTTEHAFDDGRREIVANHASPQITHGKLQQASQHHGDQKRFERSQAVDGSKHDHGKPGRWPGDPES